MSSSCDNADCLAWAARDESGFLSPYKFSRRALGSDDVSIRITHCGVCYADLIWARNGHGDSKYPLVPGHEIVGIVKEVGTNVRRFKVGDHIGVGTYVNSCRDCEYCNDGDEVYCDKGIAFTFNDVDADGISCVQLTLCGKMFLGLIRDHLKCKNFIVGAVHLLLSQFTWHVSLSNVGGKWDEGVSSAPQLLDILPLKGVFEWYEMNLPQPWELIEEQILWPFDREKEKEMGLNVVSLQYTFGNVCLFGYEVEAFKKWRERLKATDQCMPPLVLVDVIGKLGVMFDI